VTTERETATGLRLLAPQAGTSRRYQSPGYRAKLLLLGPPLRTAQLVHERISKRVALAVFSSDPISSTAYATEEMLLVLVAGGAGAVGLALPLAAAVAVLLLVLVLSYRQVIAAYPQGGGAYMVTRDNLGNLLASVCASALLVDYVLTVAVSVSAGTAALASAIHPLRFHRVEISAGFVILLAWGTCAASASPAASSPSPPTSTSSVWVGSSATASSGCSPATSGRSPTSRRRSPSSPAPAPRSARSRCSCSCTPSRPAPPP